MNEVNKAALIGGPIGIGGTAIERDSAIVAREAKS